MRPASAGTQYHLASLTKPFAAVLLLQLVNEGRLRLEQPVADVYGPEAAERNSRRTLSYRVSCHNPNARYTIHIAARDRYAHRRSVTLRKRCN